MKNTTTIFLILFAFLALKANNEFGFKVNQLYLNVLSKKTKSQAPTEFAYKFSADYSKRIHKKFFGMVKIQHWGDFIQMRMYNDQVKNTLISAGSGIKYRLIDKGRFLFDINYTFNLNSVYYYRKNSGSPTSGNVNSAFHQMEFDLIAVIKPRLNVLCGLSIIKNTSSRNNLIIPNNLSSLIQIGLIYSH